MCIMIIFDKDILNNKNNPPFLTPCRVKASKTTTNPHAVNSRASRERTASVRRWHGELGVLIKIFYKSACAVHMLDNRLEWRGVWRILKQLPALKPPPRTLKLTPRSTWWKNVHHLTFTFKDKVNTVVFMLVETFSLCYSIIWTYFIFQARREQWENNSALWLKDNSVDEGVAPLVWRFGEFPILISNPAPCNGRWHLLY